MLKRYYSIEEAAEFLNNEKHQNEKINRTDIFDIAAQGYIRLCAWFDGRLEVIEIYDDPKCPTADFFDTWYFRGYLEIPPDSITPKGSEISYYPKKFIEKRAGNFDSTLLNPLIYVNQINTNLDDSVVPAQDLLNFSSQTIEAQKAAKKPLSTTERNTLLTIIGLMAKDGYRDDLSKRYPLANKIQLAANLLDIPISAETIANKFKDAKEILDENSE